jgi:hypothetical protein
VSAGLVVVVMALWMGVLGYLIGLTRFRAALRRMALRRTNHTVVLDGASGSGKTTLRLRLSYPCSERSQLERLAATSDAALHRPLPLCFDPPTRLHVLQFGDVPGEKSEGVDRVIRAAEGIVIAVWVWDLSRTDAENQEVMNVARLRAVYQTQNGKRVERVIVFLNKTDQLTLDAHNQAQIDDTEALIRRMAVEVFGSQMAVTFHRGSALDGTGVFDAYGSMLRALGLEEHFKSLDVPTRAGEAA